MGIFLALDRLLEFAVIFIAGRVCSMPSGSDSADRFGV
jgi:hypothetical protein